MATPVKYRNGLLGTCLFHLALLLLMLFMAFRTPLPLPAEQGIMVDFGDSDFGTGNIEPRTNNPVVVQPQPETQNIPQPEQQNLTQDIEETASLPPKPTETVIERPQKETVTVETPKPSETTNETKLVEAKPVERTVDPRSLYPGRGETSSTANSQGEAGGQGNQGTPSGAPNVHVYGEGIDIGGGLEGRGTVGGLPRPIYNVQEHGVVVVAITVDKDGRVLEANAGAKGSTTLNQTLLDAARKAALQTKFSANPNRLEQKGTITYTFKLGE